MCYTIAIHLTRAEIEERFQVLFDEHADFSPNYYVSAFDLPFVPVITSSSPEIITLSQWGLIPYWVKDRDYANQIRYKTFNARAESIMTKPSFKNSIKNKRCLVITNGFYEWHTHKDKKYPFYIHLKHNKIFALAGIFDHWADPDTGELLHTFSVVTTTANPLMEKVHNSKKRMPVILPPQIEKDWLTNQLSEKEVLKYLTPYKEDDMIAYSISKQITKKGTERNTPQLIQPFHYTDLDYLKI